MGNTLNGNNGEFIKRKIIFAPPPHDAVVSVTSVKNNVIVDSAEIVELGFVLVKGYLNKSIEYNTANRGMLKKLMGNEEKSEEKDSDKEVKVKEEQKDSDKEVEVKDEQKDSDKEKEKEKDKEKDKKKNKKEVVCESMMPEPQAMAIDGVVRHTTMWIPYDILVKVDGARVGDSVTEASVEIKPLIDNKLVEELVEDGLIVGAITNDVINVSITVKQKR